MSHEQEIIQSVSDVAAQCSLEGPKNISIQQGLSYASGYTAEMGYYFIDCSSEPYVKGQDALVHEAAHLVRKYNEINSKIGMDDELYRISRLVDADIQHGLLGTNFITLNNLMFSQGVSEELTACYFGVDRDRKDALRGASELKSESSIMILQTKIREWKQYVYAHTGQPLRIDDKCISEMISCLDYSKNLGKFGGSIIGNWLVSEQVTPREVMLHDPSKLFEMFEDLVVLEKFPKDLAEFIRQRGVFKID
jgi:hypothetical protein